MDKHLLCGMENGDVFSFPIFGLPRSIMAMVKKAKHMKFINSMASHDSLLIVGSDDGIASVWNLTENGSFQYLDTISLENKRITTVEITDQVICIGGADSHTSESGGFVHVYPYDPNRMRNRFFKDRHKSINSEGRVRLVRHVSTNDSALLLVAFDKSRNDGGYIQVLEPDSDFAMRQCVQVGTSSIVAMELDQDNFLIVATREDGVFQLSYDPVEGNFGKDPIRVFSDDQGEGLNNAVVKNGCLFTRSFYGKVLKFNLKDPKAGPVTVIEGDDDKKSNYWGSRLAVSDCQVMSVSEGDDRKTIQVNASD